MKRTRFLEILRTLSPERKKDICCFVDGMPFSWSVAFLEVYLETKLGQKILKELENYERQTTIE